jgi:hypothetical protein
MTDGEFMSAFENGSLPADSFHHADHVRMAFLYLSRFPIGEALSRFSDSLKRFATAHGKPERYHQTITYGFLFLVGERRARQPQNNNDWEAFAKDNQDLLDWKNNALKRYYSEATLASDLARRTFVLPDRGL